jgi:hypothetical protein
MPEPTGIKYTVVGVGAVISGQFSGWNLGLANGWGSMLFATLVITAMYLGLTCPSSPWWGWSRASTPSASPRAGRSTH